MVKGSYKYLARILLVSHQPSGKYLVRVLLVSCQYLVSLLSVSCQSLVSLLSVSCQSLVRVLLVSCQPSSQSQVCSLKLVLKMGFNGKSAGDRDGARDIYPYGCVFSIYIQPLQDEQGLPTESSDLAWLYLYSVFIRDKSSVAKQYSLTVKNLPYGKYYYKFEPHPVPRPDNKLWENIENGGDVVYEGFLDYLFDPPDEPPIGYDNYFDYLFPYGTDNFETLANINTGIVDVVNGVTRPVARLGVSGVRSTINTSLVLGGKTIQLEGEWENTPSNGDIEETVKEMYDRRSASSDQGSPIKITSITEEVKPSDVNFDVTYPKIAMCGIKIKASERITSAPEISLFISEGRIILNSLASGVHQNPPSTVLRDYTENFSVEEEIVAGTTIVRNLETGFQSTLTNKTTIDLTSGTLFNTGDRYLVFNIQPSNYFPDIFVDLLINPDGGLGSIVDKDRDIDYASIVKCRRFCKEKGFYWDGVISTQVNLSNWATKNAPSSLLIPTKISGMYGLTFESPDLELKAVFNESNIIKDSFEEEFTPWEDNSVNQVILKYTNGLDSQRPAEAVLAQTRALADGLETVNSISVEYPEITSVLQAKEVAGMVLNTKRYQNKAVRFSTASQGMYLKPSDLILVQHQVTEYLHEVSGYVVFADTYDEDNRTQRIALSRDFVNPSVLEDFSLTIQFQSTGEVIEDLPFTIELENDFRYLVVTDLDNFVSIGDAVIVGKVSVNNRYYRVQSISNQEGVYSINGLLWDTEMFNMDDLVFTLSG